MMTTITLAKVSAGVDMHVAQEGIPAVIPVARWYAGLPVNPTFQLSNQLKNFFLKRTSGSALGCLIFTAGK